MNEHSTPPIHFAPARGARLAYQVFGISEPTVVAIPPLAQNIEMGWELPEIRAMLERFGSFCRYVHFDKRSTGASDRRSQIPGIDERVDDLRAVMDHAGVDRAHLFANSEGGPMVLMFAATYPARVESLTLWGTGATLGPPPMTEAEIASREERVEKFLAAWGTPDSPVVDMFAPSRASDQEFRRWHQRYERLAATTRSLRDLLDLSLEMDAREVLATLDVPTLVLHRVDDGIVPIELGRELASDIADAQIVELSGEDHFAYLGDVDTWMTEFERFVTGSVKTRPMATSVSSEARIVTLGDFGVQINGEVVPSSAWGSRLARQLCKRLVAARGWPVTRDELIELLWPGEHNRQQLGARLSVQLSTVRRILNGGVIADRQTVRLNLEEVSTDLEDFMTVDDDPAIVASYSGEFLPGDIYEDWSGGTRDEVRGRFIGAARRLASQHRAAARYDEAVRLLRRLTGADRYDEDAHRALVATLIESGEIGASRQAHARWAEAMTELDIEIEPFDPRS